MTIDWVSHIRDDIAINRLAIPGTHDAASWTHDDDLDFPPFTWAQRLNFTQQLDLGIRVLDLRIGWSNAWNRNLRMVHGPAPVNDQSLDDVLAEIRGWLDANANEFVILMFQQQGLIPGDCTRDVETLINNRFGAFAGGRFFYFARNRIAWPTVGQLRGRVMVMERLGSRVRGFCDISGWQAAGATPGALLDVGDNLNIYLQDKFNGVSGPGGFQSFGDDCRKKVAFVEAAAKHVPSRPSPTVLKINHSSFSHKMWQPWELGERVNQLLCASAARIQGIMMIDDADQNTVAHILSHNPGFMRQ